MSVIDATEDRSYPMTGIRSRRGAGPDGAEVVIDVSGLHMSYDGFEAVRGIDLRVRRGEIFTFLGPNGAGKTTTVEILEGHRTRTGGDVRVLGEDPEHADRWWRSRVGVVLQSSRAEPQLTVRECLELYAGYDPAPRSVQEVIELVGLKKRSEVRCGHLSGGQQRRVDVALALIGDPELVFLDEPTTGFDPSARRSAWEMIDGLRQLGKTIFLTTHYMDEAEALADRVAVIKAGVIVAEGTPATLGGRDRAAYHITFSLPQGVATDELPVSREPHSQRGLRPAPDPSDRPAALFRIRRFRANEPAAPYAAGHRQRVSGRPPQQRALQGIRSVDNRVGHRRDTSLGRRGVGRRRAHHRPVALLVVPPINLRKGSDMASTFDITFSVPDAPAEAQARAADALAEPALAVGLRLTARGAGELRYGPRVQWPFLIVLWHKLNGEKLTVTFEPGESGGTSVSIAGAVARGKHSLAADPEHWREPLGASTVTVEFADQFRAPLPRR